MHAMGQYSIDFKKLKNQDWGSFIAWFKKPNDFLELLSSMSNQKIVTLLTTQNTAERNLAYVLARRYPDLMIDVLKQIANKRTVIREIIHSRVGLNISILMAIVASAPSRFGDIIKIAKLSIQTLRDELKHRSKNNCSIGVICEEYDVAKKIINSIQDKRKRELVTTAINNARELIVAQTLVTMHGQSLKRNLLNKKNKPTGNVSLKRSRSNNYNHRKRAIKQRTKRVCMTD